LAENVIIIQKKRKRWWRGEGSEGEVVEGAKHCRFLVSLEVLR
jgi:hypothetical protein